MQEEAGGEIGERLSNATGNSILYKVYTEEGTFRRGGNGLSDRILVLECSRKKGGKLWYGP